VFVGIVTFKKDIVEVVKVDAKDSEEATSILAEYVYKKYNKELKDANHYFKGEIIDTRSLKIISSMKECV
jgi:hypothetical protein